MTPTLRRLILILLAGAVLVVVAVSCQAPKGNDDRITKLESSVANVSSIATRVETLEGNDQGIGGQVAGISQTIAAQQAKIDELTKELQTAMANNTALKKKVDTAATQAAAAVGSAAKVTSLEQKLTLLETRYNDHLRKYHGG